MESIAVTKPDMRIERQESLSPFGFLNRVFAEELIRRNSQDIGYYRPMRLAYLEEEAPEAELGCEAVALYRRQFPYTDLTDAEVYSLIFAHGELTPAVYTLSEILPVEIETEDEIALPGTELKLSCIARQDEGDGFEFAFLADFYLVPSTRSPFGWLVNKVFFPE